MASFIHREGAADLAKTVHSVTATVTTTFLATRLWAKTTHFKGLWWDDYVLTAAWAALLSANGLAGAAPSYGFNIVDGTSFGLSLHMASGSCFYLAAGLAKSAFALTLIRLSLGWKRSVLWAIIILVNAYNIAMMVIAWVDVCEVTSEGHSIGSKAGNQCGRLETFIWVHLGNAIVMFVADGILTCFPWTIIRQVEYIPPKEKWGVAVAMGLVGLAPLVAVVKMAFLAQLPMRYTPGDPDYTYGLVAAVCVMNMETTVYVVAQTIPILRTLWQGSSKGWSRDISTIRDTQAQATSKTTEKNATNPAARQSIELLQLPGGRIVTSDSEEGRAHQSGSAAILESADVPLPSSEAETQITTEAAAIGGQRGQRVSTVSVDDEVHKLWAEMGLSRRAWSKSPSPAPERSFQR